MRRIYLDNSATTKICDEALNKYVDVSREFFGNPSSLHTMGFEAEREINKTKDAIIASLGARGSAVVFTSSGSEANNLAIIGRALSKDRYKRSGKIITTVGEHASVSSPTSQLRAMGFSVAEIGTKGGKLDMESLIKEMTPDVILVTMMMVNNETGALYDVSRVSKIMQMRSREAVLHVDATQSYMKIPFTKASLGADMITLSSHKIEGPKGVGALVIDDKIIKTRGLVPIILGGGQEGGLRSGTENVPGIAAFGKAVELGARNLKERYLKCDGLRSYLIEKLSTVPELSEISPTLPEKHAPHIISLSLPGIKSETMLHHLSSLGIYVSSGSACSSNGAHHTSAALTSYGLSREEADSSIRISFSHTNEESDVDALIEGLISGLTKLQRIKK